MNATAPHNPADRFAITFEEMRATMAAEEKRKGLAGALQRAILGLLNAILALLADLRDGRLAAGPLAAGPLAAAPPACAAGATRAGPAGEGLCGTGAASGERDRDFRAAVATVPPAAGGDVCADRGAAAAGARNPKAALPDAGSAELAEGVVATAAEAEGTQTLIEPPSAFAAGGCIQAAPHCVYVASPLTLRLRGRMARLAVSDSKNRVQGASGWRAHFVTN
jgi:hypothetical protein